MAYHFATEIAKLCYSILQFIIFAQLRQHSNCVNTYDSFVCTVQNMNYESQWRRIMQADWHKFSIADYA